MRRKREKVNWRHTICRIARGHYTVSGNSGFSDLPGRIERRLGGFKPVEWCYIDENGRVALWADRLDRLRGHIERMYFRYPMEGHGIKQNGGAI